MSRPLCFLFIQIINVSLANEEGITSLHNAICAGHLDVCRFLIQRGADVNAVDSDGWCVQILEILIHLSYQYIIYGHVDFSVVPDSHFTT